MQAAAANIPERSTLYRKIYSALRPSGKFALYDTFEGSNSGIRFPVPWSIDGSTSTLLTEVTTIEICEECGLKCIAQRPEPRTLAWVREQFEINSVWDGKGVPPFGQNILLKDFVEMCSSQIENLLRGKVRFGYLIFEKL
jgi:hypothetical protein